MMERSEILTAMSDLKLFGMKAAFDEIITTAVKRQHEPQHIVGDLLSAEISETEGPARHRSEGGPEGTVDPLPDQHRQTAAGQGRGRVPVRRHAN